MMGAMSRRCSSGAMRATGPKSRVSSVRVGPCQASAIEPPREPGWQGMQGGRLAVARKYYLGGKESHLRPSGLLDTRALKVATDMRRQMKEAVPAGLDTGSPAPLCPR